MAFLDRLPSSPEILEMLKRKIAFKCARIDWVKKLACEGNSKYFDRK